MATAQQSLAEAFGHAGEDDPQEASDSLSSLCDDYLALDQEVAAINERLKDAKEARDKCEEAILARLKEQGVKSIKTRSGYRFTSVEKEYFSLPPQKEPDKRDAAVLWLKRVGAKELFKEQISESTMTSFLRERLEAGKQVSELIGKFVKIALSVVKDKKKS